MHTVICREKAGRGNRVTIYNKERRLSLRKKEEPIY